MEGERAFGIAFPTPTVERSTEETETPRAIITIDGSRTWA